MGIDHIRDYKDNLSRDFNISPPNVYANNGQGCGTVWYPTVPEARKVLQKFRELMKNEEATPEGSDSGLCILCKCHYSFHSDEHGVALQDHLCTKWKELMAKGDFEGARKLAQKLLDKHEHTLLQLRKAEKDRKN